MFGSSDRVETPDSTCSSQSHFVKIQNGSYLTVHQLANGCMVKPLPEPVSNKTCTKYRDIKHLINCYEQLLKREFLRFCPTATATPTLSQRIDFLWQGFAGELFEILQHQFGFHWQLINYTKWLDGKLYVDPPCFEYLIDRVSGETFAPPATVRFRCENCQHCWTSKKGLVEFKFLQETPTQGYVFFQLFHQKCFCGSPVPVLWFDDEVVRILVVLYLHMAKRFHNNVNVSIPIDNFDQCLPRCGSRKRKHDQRRCNACLMGKCSYKKPS